VPTHTMGWVPTCPHAHGGGWVPAHVCVRAHCVCARVFVLVPGLVCVYVEWGLHWDGLGNRLRVVCVDACRC